jgi:hypothetical protein
MNKLIYDTNSHGQKVIFSTAQELDSWLAEQQRGILFAVNNRNAVYTVIKIDGEAPWAISSLNEFRSITFNNLVNQYGLYFIDDNQMIGLIEVCEN